MQEIDKLKVSLAQSEDKHQNTIERQKESREARQVSEFNNFSVVLCLFEHHLDAVHVWTCNYCQFGVFYCPHFQICSWLVDILGALWCHLGSGLELRVSVFCGFRWSQYLKGEGQSLSLSILVSTPFLLFYLCNSQSLPPCLHRVGCVWVCTMGDTDL